MNFFDVFTGGVIIKASISPWFPNGNVLEYVQRYPEADRVDLVVFLLFFF